MSPMVNTGYVGEESFLRKFAFHEVTDAATRHNVSANIPLFVANAINACVLHSRQPNQVRTGSVRWRLPTISTVFYDYLSNLRKRKSEFSSIIFGLAAVLTMNPLNSRLKSIPTRNANTSSEATFSPETAGSGIFQICERYSLFSSTSTAHKPVVYRLKTQLPRFSFVRPGVTDNCKVAKLLVCNINEFHRSDFSIALERGQ